MSTSTPKPTPTPTLTTLEKLKNALDVAFEDSKNAAEISAQDVAEWLQKEFHITPKTAEEKTAAQNVAAAESVAAKGA